MGKVVDGVYLADDTDVPKMGNVVKYDDRYFVVFTVLGPGEFLALDMAEERTDIFLEMKTDAVTVVAKTVKEFIQMAVASTLEAMK